MNKAERDYMRQTEVIKVGLQKLLQQMSDVLAEFRATPTDAKRFVTEMQVVQRRQEWLRLVLDGSPEALVDAIQKSLAHTRDSASDAASSRDASSVLRVGPCADYDQLQVFSTMEDHRAKFRACASPDQVKETFNAMGRLRKLYNVLSVACRTAVSDLNSARLAARTAEENKKKS